MLSKYTVVGMAVGIVISGIGIWALAASLINPVRTVEFDENLEAGNHQTYSFNAPANSEQEIAVVGDSARIALTKPGGPEHGYVFKTNGDYCKKHNVSSNFDKHEIYKIIESCLING